LLLLLRFRSLVRSINFFRERVERDAVVNI
jgi:hypothetical protein